MTDKVEILKLKDLVPMIAETSGYYKSEVKQVIEHMVAHIQILLRSNKQVRIAGLGTFRRIDFISKLKKGPNGQILPEPTPTFVVKFKPDNELTEIVRGKRPAAGESSSS